MGYHSSQLRCSLGCKTKNNKKAECPLWCFQREVARAAESSLLSARTLSRVWAPGQKMYREENR